MLPYFPCSWVQRSITNYNATDMILFHFVLTLFTILSVLCNFPCDFTSLAHRNKVISCKTLHARRRLSIFMWLLCCRILSKFFWTCHYSIAREIASSNNKERIVLKHLGTGNLVSVNPQGLSSAFASLVRYSLGLQVYKLHRYCDTSG